MGSARRMYLVDCRNCGYIHKVSALGLTHCRYCHSKHPHHLVYVQSKITCQRCQTENLRPNWRGKKNCYECGFSFYTAANRVGETFFVGQAVYFVSKSGVPRPGNIVSIEDDGHMVSLQHAEREWSDSRFNAVHSIDDVAVGLSKCCELRSGKRRTTR